MRQTQLAGQELLGQKQRSFTFRDLPHGKLKLIDAANYENAEYKMLSKLTMIIMIVSSISMLQSHHNNYHCYTLSG